MIVSLVRKIFPKQAEKHELSAKDAWISDTIWIVCALLYFIYIN